MKHSAVRIEVCGGIASGKTTLCNLIKENGWPAVFENFRSNPFWRLFYKDPLTYAFEAEVAFLLQHYCDVKVAANDHVKFICDYAMLQDGAYAAINLSGGRLQAFQCVYNQVAAELPPVSLIVHLECRPQDQLARVRYRSRKEEKSIRVEYLAELNKSISRAVAVVGTQTRIVTIDSSVRDFARNTAIQKEVVRQVLGAVVC